MRIQAATEERTRTANAKDGSNGKPAGESAAAAALRHKEISAGCPMIMSDILTKNLRGRLLHKYEIFTKYAETTAKYREDL